MQLGESVRSKSELETSPNSENLVLRPARVKTVSSLLGACLSQQSALQPPPPPPLGGLVVRFQVKLPLFLSGHAQPGIPLDANEALPAPQLQPMIYTHTQTPTQLPRLILLLLTPSKRAVPSP